MRNSCICECVGVASAWPAIGTPASASSLFNRPARRAKEIPMALTLFLTVDVLASIALAAWLGSRGDDSDWER